MFYKIGQMIRGFMGKGGSRSHGSTPASGSHHAGGGLMGKLRRFI